MYAYTFDYGISLYYSDSVRIIGIVLRIGMGYLVTQTNIGFLWASKSPKGNRLLQIA